MSSVLIKDGTLYDPLLQQFQQQDLYFGGKQIIAKEQAGTPELIVDAGGCLVVPGLIDAHLHVFQDGCDGGVNADLACLPNGVTTVVDGGSCGESNYRIFHNYTIARSDTTIKSCLNISSSGLASTRFVENLDPDCFSWERIEELFSLYPGELVALKVRMSQGIVPVNDFRALEKTLVFAERLNCPVVVHMTDPAVDSESVTNLLRAGDVFCHVFHGAGQTIIGEDGRVRPGIVAAQRRGVLFDACHGRVNFTFCTASAALTDGFLPDIISTDLSPKTMYREPVVSLPRLLAKFMAMGLGLRQVLDRVTLNPARWLGLEQDLATLRPGSVADVAILKLVDQQCSFTDYLGDKIHGAQQLLPRMTIKQGAILSCAADFSQELVL